jgi:hypothetical protein
MEALLEQQQQQQQQQQQHELQQQQQHELQQQQLHVAAAAAALGLPHHQHSSYNMDMSKSLATSGAYSHSQLPPLSYANSNIDPFSNVAAIRAYNNNIQNNPNSSTNGSNGPGSGLSPFDSALQNQLGQLSCSPLGPNIGQLGGLGPSINALSAAAAANYHHQQFAPVSQASLMNSSSGSIVGLGVSNNGNMLGCSTSNGIPTSAANYLSGPGYSSSNLSNCSPMEGLMGSGPISPSATRDSTGTMDNKDGA